MDNLLSTQSSCYLPQGVGSYTRPTQCSPIVLSLPACECEVSGSRLRSSLSYLLSSLEVNMRLVVVS